MNEFQRIVVGLELLAARGTIVRVALQDPELGPEETLRLNLLGWTNVKLDPLGPVFWVFDPKGRI